MSSKTFATIINCMDGRTQDPVNVWAKEHLAVEYVDVITEPGPDGILAQEDHELCASIQNRVDISIHKHGSRHIIVVSHDDCAGNPVSKDQHLSDLEKAIDTVKSWEYPAQIIGVWVDSEWVVHKIIS